MLCSCTDLKLIHAITFLKKFQEIIVSVKFFHYVNPSIQCIMDSFYPINGF